MVEAALGQGRVIARGGGYSYAAASFGGGSLVLDMTRFDRVLRFEPEEGLVEVEAGMRLEQLLALTAPRGLILPVQPGYPAITVGGCIAGNVHGKNPHREGTFRRSVVDLTLLHPRLGTLRLDRQNEPELFELTCGGYGLTGDHPRRDPAAGAACPAGRPRSSASRSRPGRGSRAGPRADAAIAPSRTRGTTGRRSRERSVAASSTWAGFPKVLCRRARWCRATGASPPRAGRGFGCRSGDARRAACSAGVSCLRGVAAPPSVMPLFDALFPFARRGEYFLLYGRRGLAEVQSLVPHGAADDFLRALEREVLLLRPPARHGLDEALPRGGALPALRGRRRVCHDRPRALPPRASASWRCSTGSLSSSAGCRTSSRTRAFPRTWSRALPRVRGIPGEAAGDSIPGALPIGALGEAGAVTAVVVGASAGLGRALAEALAAAGHDLVVVSSDARDLEALAVGPARSVTGCGSRPSPLDLGGEPSGVERLGEAVAELGEPPTRSSCRSAGPPTTDDATLDADLAERLVQDELPARWPPWSGASCPSCSAAPRQRRGLRQRGRAPRPRVERALRRVQAGAPDRTSRACATPARARRVAVSFYVLGYLDTNLAFGRRTLFRGPTRARLAERVVRRAGPGARESCTILGPGASSSPRCRSFPSSSTSA